MTTEIYICKDGQDLKQGKLVYSSDIDDRAGAEEDAKRRCQGDPTIKKIAYYKVASDGDFRVFFSYTNPNCKPAAKPQPAGAAPKKKPQPAKKKPPPSLLERIKKKIGL
ncbi:MAG: hypothetical protein EPN20_02365 [Magnetospirillum sp.]|nr:MAG: hypothetical protein EPN20_02365 [Magnetospirillum sp.]